MQVTSGIRENKGVIANQGDEGATSPESATWQFGAPELASVRSRHGCYFAFQTEEKNVVGFHTEKVRGRQKAPVKGAPTHEKSVCRVQSGSSH